MLAKTTHLTMACCAQSADAQSHSKTQKKTNTQGQVPDVYQDDVHRSSEARLSPASSPQSSNHASNIKHKDEDANSKPSTSSTTGCIVPKAMANSSDAWMKVKHAPYYVRKNPNQVLPMAPGAASYSQDPTPPSPSAGQMHACQVQLAKALT